MKRLLGLFLVLTMLTLVVVPNTAVAADDGYFDGEWLVMMDPPVVFAGDNVTIFVRGAPAVFIGLTILNESGVVIYMDYAAIMSNGLLKYPWTVPVSMPSGIYTTVVNWDDTNVTSASFEIIYDKDVEQDVIIDDLLDKIDALEDSNRELLRRYNLIIEQRDTFYLVGIVAAVMSFALLMFILMFLNPVIQYYWGKSTRHGGKKTVYSLLRPPRRGQFAPYHEYVEKNMDEAKREREAARGEIRYHNDLLFVADPNNPFGYDISEVEIANVSDMNVRIQPASVDNLKKMKRAQMNGGEIKPRRFRFLKERGKRVVELDADDVSVKDESVKQ